MRALQEEEACKREKRLLSMYEKWKFQMSKARNQLKAYMSEGELWTLVDELKRAQKDVLNAYGELRNLVTPSQATKGRADTCVAVTNDLTSLIYDRATYEECDFDAQHEKGRLHELRRPEYARSVYGSGSDISTLSRSQSEHGSAAAKLVEAAAELAEKEANFQMMQKEAKQKEAIRELEEKQRRAIHDLEEQQRKALEVQKRELERLQAEKEVVAAHAKLQVLKEMNHEAADHSNNPTPESRDAPPAILPSSHATATSHSDILSLARVFQDSIALSRLPAPEPFVFNGDPIQFIEWKTTFTSLIGQRATIPAEKLYYLKRYVGGPARQALDGTFYRTDNEAYKDAWDKLNQRFGQPFTIQRSFREKLSNWPRIQPKDSEGLRSFSDFLNACQQAIPHVEGLDILNDCEENQKLVLKLPDWTASRWNRQVTQSLSEHQKFPTFMDFAKFMSIEADVACNPITSHQALLKRLSVPGTEKGNVRDTKRNKASVFTTQTTTDQSKRKTPCIRCEDEGHQLHACGKFTEMSLDERRNYVKEKKLCYGCLKPGHNAKDCRHRHSCYTCKRKHPTALHDDNYKREERAAPETASNQDATGRALSVAVQGSSSTSMVIPVWVSSQNKPTEEILVYALLDTQSDTTFIDQEVSNGLITDKRPVKLELTTMSGKDTVLTCERVSGLRVRGYSSLTQVDLPVAYTKDCIPVTRALIPTHETAKKWSHLAGIAHEIPPLQSCDVGLLIGYNCSRAMAPRQVILGADEEPYAVRTDLGWSIVGRSSQGQDPLSTSCPCHRIAVKELPPATPADVIHILESDFKDGNEDGWKTVSSPTWSDISSLSDSVRTRLSSESDYSSADSRVESVKQVKRKAQENKKKTNNVPNNTIDKKISDLYKSSNADSAASKTDVDGKVLKRHKVKHKHKTKEKDKAPSLVLNQDMNEKFVKSFSFDFDDSRQKSVIGESDSPVEGKIKLSKREKDHSKKDRLSKSKTEDKEGNVKEKHKEEKKKRSKEKPSKVDRKSEPKEDKHLKAEKEKNVKEYKEYKANNTVKLIVETVKDGILRVGGRLRHSTLPHSAKYPAIILKDHHVTEMIIAHYKKKKKKREKKWVTKKKITRA